MQGNEFNLIGKVTDDKKLIIGNLINENIDELRKVYHKTFDGELNEA